MSIVSSAYIAHSSAPCLCKQRPCANTLHPSPAFVLDSGHGGARQSFFASKLLPPSLSSLPVSLARTHAAPAPHLQHLQRPAQPALPPLQSARLLTRVQDVFSQLGLAPRKLHISAAASTMNAAADGAPQALQNGGGVASQSNGHTSDFSQVLEAIQAVYAPTSSNDTRRQATEYLEQAKRDPNAPSHGYTLAADQSQLVHVRYYGLGLLEYTIKYSWDDLTADQGAELMGYVLRLANTVTENDQTYFRNKVAQLWTEVAKRSWGAEWLNMDEQLVSLWTMSLHHQAIVLYVLETLSEEVFNREDATAGLRGSDLGRACVEIFTPLQVLQEQLPTRDKSLDVRCGDEGWLKRLCDNLGWCLEQDCQNQENVRSSAAKTLNALRAAMPWIIPKAIAATGVIEAVCKALSVPVVELQLV
jgi:exportin-5